MGHRLFDLFRMMKTYPNHCLSEKIVTVWMIRISKTKDSEPNNLVKDFNLSKKVRLVE